MVERKLIIYFHDSFFIYHLLCLNYKKTSLNHRTIGLFLVLFAVLCIYIYLSEINGNMVLYGRTIKPLIPLACIACSYSFIIIMKIGFLKFKSSKIFISSIFFITIFYNHYRVLNISFPNEFRSKAHEVSNSYNEFTTLTGKNINTLEILKIRKIFSYQHKLVSSSISNNLTFTPSGKIIFKSKHPCKSFPPYQFYIIIRMNETLSTQTNLICCS